MEKYTGIILTWKFSEITCSQITSQLPEVAFLLYVAFIITTRKWLNSITLFPLLASKSKKIRYRVMQWQCYRWKPSQPIIVTCWKISKSNPKYYLCSATQNDNQWAKDSSNVVKVCSQHIKWTEQNSRSEHVHSNGSVHSARTDWAPTVLVSLQPIKSWRWRAWPLRRTRLETGSTCRRSVQLSSCVVNEP